MKLQQAKLMRAMIRYDRGDTARIQHLIKVHDLAVLIGTLEGMEPDNLYILEAAAIVHDIGIHPSEAKYGSSSGKYQELEGPPEAERLLREIGGYTEAQIERIKYLVGHHHTYQDMDGLDYQILVEADFLVNLYEYQNRYDAILAAQKNLFRTETGKSILRDMFERSYI
jgi:HD superfamily phosphodiesterase